MPVLSLSLSIYFCKELKERRERSRQVDALDCIFHLLALEEKRREEMKRKESLKEVSTCRAKGENRWWPTVLCGRPNQLPTLDQPFPWTLHQLLSSAVQAKREETEEEKKHCFDQANEWNQSGLLVSLFLSLRGWPNNNHSKQVNEIRRLILIDFKASRASVNSSRATQLGDCRAPLFTSFGCLVSLVLETRDRPRKPTCCCWLKLSEVEVSTTNLKKPNTNVKLKYSVRALVACCLV